MYPLEVKWCVDREKSRAEWTFSTLKPDISWIDEAESVVFKRNCLGSSHLARVEERRGWLLYSNSLKKLIEKFNPKGIVFRSDSTETLSVRF